MIQTFTRAGARLNISQQEAEKQYRICWNQYLLTTKPARKRALEEVMDMLQCCISERPGQRFDEFKQTLPGFADFWQRTFENLFLMRPR